jgi:PIN domain nuclease of toxin-antitoxin system
VKLLLNTQLRLWAAGQPKRLRIAARSLIDDPQNQLLFSATSLWEVAINSGLGLSDLRADARLPRRGLIDNGYDELPITGEHAVAIANLPPIHKGSLRSPAGCPIGRLGHPANRRPDPRRVPGARAQGELHLPLRQSQKPSAPAELPRRLHRFRRRGPVAQPADRAHRPRPDQNPGSSPPSEPPISLAAYRR